MVAAVDAADAAAEIPVVVDADVGAVDFNNSS